MLESLSDGTIKQYNKALRLWWIFCQEKEVSPFEYSVPRALQFFASLTREVNSYSTLNMYRSAISLLSSNELGKDSRILRFFKGISVTKPQKPKYPFIWDPHPVLNYLATLYPNTELSLENLTKKLVTLLALITAQRVQTLSLIKTENITFTETLAQIKIPDRIKTSGRDRDQPLLNIPFFKEKPALCAASVLQQYIQQTTKLRQNESNMLITFRRPHRQASCQTISRWIKDSLEKAGIDTQIFSAHSTRHAATSFAARKGVNIEVIRRTAGWTEKSKVFNRFYNRPMLRSANFASVIINNV